MIQAAPELEILGGRLPEPSDLERITQEFGFELASMVLYRALETSPLHQSYQTFLRQYATDFRRENDDYTVLIVAEAPFLLQPAWQNPQSHLDQIAFQAGFRSEVMARPKGGSAVDWALALRERLQSTPRAIVLSYGFGGAIVRQLLAREPSSPETGHLVGWVNLSGGVAGYELHERALEPFWTRAWTHFRSGLHFTGIHRVREGAAMRLLTRSDAGILDVRFPIVSVYGMAMKPGLHAHLRRGFHQLIRKGPTDGVNSWAELLGLPGAFIPLWGQDTRLNRFLRTNILRKILCALAESADKKAHTALKASQPSSPGQTRLDLSL